MRAVVVAVVVLGFAGFASAADEKLDTKKLIGKWEPEKADPKGPTMVLEIQDKGKFAIHITFNGKTEKIDGTYKIDGNKIEVEMKFMGETMKETLTITKLTDTEMVSKDSKGKEEKMVKVKEKGKEKEKDK